MPKSIRGKLFIFVIFLISATLILFSLMIKDIMEGQLRKELFERTKLLAKSISDTTSYSLAAGDILGLDHTIFHVKEKHPDIEYIGITDKEGTIITHTDLTRKGQKIEFLQNKKSKDSEALIIKRTNTGFEIIVPVTFANQHIGQLIMGTNETIIKEAHRRTNLALLITLLLILAIASAGTFFLSRTITQPIHELINGIENLRYNRVDKPLRIYSEDELGKLTYHFNEMASTIRSQQESLNKYARELEDAYISTVKVLAAAIDARDPFTLGHSTRIAAYSVKLGEKLGLSRNELDDLEIACLFHDIGKLKIPDSILVKRGPLEPSEYREVMRHPEYGAEILRRAYSLHRYIPAVLHHHEWFNGRGYPYGLSGKEIPVLASIISIVDAYDAMTSTRPYRKALPWKEAIEELTYWAGKQFHPEFVKAFIELLKNHRNLSFKINRSRLLI